MHVHRRICILLLVPGVAPKGSYRVTPKQPQESLWVEGAGHGP